MTSKSDKLARKLMPNQSIRSDQKKSSSTSKIYHDPPTSDYLENVIDCSKKTNSENETILENLIQIIDLSMLATQPRGKSERKQKNDDKLVSLDFIDLDLIDKKYMIELIKKNQTIFTKKQENNQFILGLNSILSYLENMKHVLIQIVELVKFSNTRCLESSSIENQHHKSEEHSMDQREYKAKFKNIFNQDEFQQLVRNLKVVKYIIVFNNHFNNQHNSIIALISAWVKHINSAFSLINSSNHSSNPHNVIATNSIELIAFPVGLVQPILKKFSIKRLSAFAILNSAPGLGKLFDPSHNQTFVPDQRDM